MSAAAVLFSFIWAAVVVPLSILLQCVGVSFDGRVFAFGSLLAGLIPWVVSYGWLKNRRRWIRAGGVSLIVCASCWIFLIAKAPSGRPDDSGKIRHVYSREGVGFNRFTLGNLLPESDQLSFAYALMTVIDPLFTVHQAAELREWTTDIYREIDRDKSFHDLGSVMPDVYAELIGGRADRGHSYLYVPASVDRSRPVHVLVFFHGSGGNFKAYMWVLTVAPSYGMGNWGNVEAQRVLDEALDAVSKIVPIDRARIDVMGLSNGGQAVSQLLAGDNARFRSLVFISPVFDITLLGYKGSLTTCPVYVLTGSEDDRIPTEYVADQVLRLKRRGVHVQERIFEGANHFLFFSHQTQMREQLEQWLREK